MFPLQNFKLHLLGADVLFSNNVYTNCFTGYLMKLYKMYMSLIQKTQTQQA